LGALQVGALGKIEPESTKMVALFLER
jgi:hypothetical protein